MTPQEYHKAYSRTLSCPRTINLVHAGVGSATEVIELEQAFAKNDRINICEELSDLHWYNDLGVDVVMRTSAKGLGLDFHLAYPQYVYEPGTDNFNFNLAQHNEAHVRSARYAVGEILDVGKRVMWYGLGLEEDGGRLLKRLVENNLAVRSAINGLCIVNNIDIALVRERNISKLWKRNQGDFDGLAFVNRDLSTERSFFEGL